MLYPGFEHEDYAVYAINNYQLIEVSSNLYIFNESKGIKISSEVLGNILQELQQQNHLELSEQQLEQIAQQHQVNATSLKNLLIEKLSIIKPIISRKFPEIYINSDDPLVSELLQKTLQKEYQLNIIQDSQHDYNRNALVLFYRQNYSNSEFKDIYHNLKEKVYLVCAGVLHNLLIIDNLYFKKSGLPTHFSNLQQILAYLHSSIPSTKNNWLLFYRDIFKQKAERFPDSNLSECQRAYIAYCLHRFTAQFTDFWHAPMTFDQINWFWQIDLTGFHIHREAAIHSPFSEFDMDLNFDTKKQTEMA